MRYLPGMIAISERADVPILRTVYRAGHLTMRQLYEFLHPSGITKNTWDSFKWRIRRLVAHLLLDSTKVDGLGAVLSLGADGEHFLQDKEPTVVERASRTTTANRRNQIWHDVDLFGIQMDLRRAGVVMAWQSESEVRAENNFTPYGYRKDYDAIVTFRIGDCCAPVALEYERTGKSSAEYERICGELNRETKMSSFLYLASSLQLQSFLVHGLRNTTRRLFVGLSHEFSRDPHKAVLIDVRRGSLGHLREYLGTTE
jgi:hypothetical protein